MYELLKPKPSEKKSSPAGVPPGCHASSELASTDACLARFISYARDKEKRVRATEESSVRGTSASFEQPDVLNVLQKAASGDLAAWETLQQLRPYAPSCSGSPHEDPQSKGEEVLYPTQDGKRLGYGGELRCADRHRALRRNLVDQISKLYKAHGVSGRANAGEAQTPTVQSQAEAAAYRILQMTDAEYNDLVRASQYHPPAGREGRTEDEERLERLREEYERAGRKEMTNAEYTGFLRISDHGLAGKGGAKDDEQLWEQSKRARLEAERLFVCHPAPHKGRAPARGEQEQEAPHRRKGKAAVGYWDAHLKVLDHRQRHGLHDGEESVDTTSDEARPEECELLPASSAAAARAAAGARARAEGVGEANERACILVVDSSRKAPLRCVRPKQVTASEKGDDSVGPRGEMYETPPVTVRPRWLSLLFTLSDARAREWDPRSFWAQRAWNEAQATKYSHFCRLQEGRSPEDPARCVVSDVGRARRGREVKFQDGMNDVSKAIQAGGPMPWEGCVASLGPKLELHCALDPVYREVRRIEADVKEAATEQTTTVPDFTNGDSVYPAYSRIGSDYPRIFRIKEIAKVPPRLKDNQEEQLERLYKLESLEDASEISAPGRALGRAPPLAERVTTCLQGQTALSRESITIENQRREIRESLQAIIESSPSAEGNGKSELREGDEVMFWAPVIDFRLAQEGSRAREMLRRRGKSDDEAQDAATKINRLLARRRERLPKHGALFSVVGVRAPRGRGAQTNYELRGLGDGKPWPFPIPRRYLRRAPGGALQKEPADLKLELRKLWRRDLLIVQRRRARIWRMHIYSGSHWLQEALEYIRQWQTDDHVLQAASRSEDEYRDILEEMQLLYPSTALPSEERQQHLNAVVDQWTRLRTLARRSDGVTVVKNLAATIATPAISAAVAKLRLPSAEAAARVEELKGQVPHVLDEGEDALIQEVWWPEAHNHLRDKLLQLHAEAREWQAITARLEGMDLNDIDLAYLDNQERVARVSQLASMDKKDILKQLGDWRRCGAELAADGVMTDEEIQVNIRNAKQKCEDENVGHLVWNGLTPRAWLHHARNTMNVPCKISNGECRLDLTADPRQASEELTPCVGTLNGASGPRCVRRAADVVEAVRSMMDHLGAAAGPGEE